MGRNMRAGKKPKKQGMSGGNMKQQMAQVQAMQRQMEEMQAEINEKEITATSGGGAVSVTITGDKSDSFGKRDSGSRRYRNVAGFNHDSD